MAEFLLSRISLTHFPSLSLSHTHAHKYTHTICISHTYIHTHPLSPSLTHLLLFKLRVVHTSSLSRVSLTHSLALLLSLSLSLTHTHIFSLSHPLSNPLSQSSLSVRQFFSLLSQSFFFFLYPPFVFSFLPFLSSKEDCCNDTEFALDRYFL